MELEKAQDVAALLKEKFLPKGHIERFERVSEVYDKMQIDPDKERFGSFSVGVSVASGSNPGKNTPSHKLMIYVHKPKGHPNLNKFKSLLSPYLGGLTVDDFQILSAEPYEGFEFEKPNKDHRTHLQNTCFTLSPGVAISVSGSSNGAIGFFTKTDAGYKAITAAHVATKDGLLGPPTDVYQPTTNGRVIGSTNPLPNTITDWHAANDAMSFSVGAKEAVDPSLLAGLQDRLNPPRNDRNDYSKELRKLGPGNGYQHGEVMVPDARAVLHSRRDPSLSWVVDGVTLVRGEYNTAFAAFQDSGAVVFDESHYLYGIVLGGNRIRRNTAPDSVVLPVHQIQEDLSLDIVW
ncbi:MAG: hypothetical protein MRY64_03825 [Hyphomonadaceae bacterium]|nr:hypothetical protein [Hyphomonadaceae bacterium]